MNKRDLMNQGMAADGNPDPSHEAIEAKQTRLERASNRLDAAIAGVGDQIIRAENVLYRLRGPVPEKDDGQPALDEDGVLPSLEYKVMYLECLLDKLNVATDELNELV